MVFLIIEDGKENVKKRDRYTDTQIGGYTERGRAK